jgi:hypothetical protein
VITQVGWLRGGAISLNIFSFFSCTHLEWVCMILNFHPFFGHAIDLKRLRLKGWNLFRVTIMRSNWGRLIVIFIIFLLSQMNQNLQLASRRCDLF